MAKEYFKITNFNIFTSNTGLILRTYQKALSLGVGSLYLTAQAGRLGNPSHEMGRRL